MRFSGCVSRGALIPKVDKQAALYRVGMIFDLWLPANRVGKAALAKSPAGKQRRRMVVLIAFSAVDWVSFYVLMLF